MDVNKIHEIKKDLGIKEDQLGQLLEAIPLLIESGARFIRKRPHADRMERLQILYPCLLVDIGIYRKQNNYACNFSKQTFYRNQPFV